MRYTHQLSYVHKFFWPNLFLISSISKHISPYTAYFKCVSLSIFSSLQAYWHIFGRFNVSDVNLIGFFKADGTIWKMDATRISICMNEQSMRKCAVLRLLPGLYNTFPSAHRREKSYRNQMFKLLWTPKCAGHVHSNISIFGRIGEDVHPDCLRQSCITILRKTHRLLTHLRDFEAASSLPQQAQTCYLINQTPGEKLRHGAANSWASQTSAPTPAKSCELLDQSDHTERNFSPRVWEQMGALCIQTQSFLLGDSSSIITLYLNPFITSNYYKNTTR